MRFSFILLIFIGLLVGCASTTQLPATINIVPPSPEIPPQIAAFSGIWEGKWRGYTDIVLVVERIDTQKAEIIYCVGANYRHDAYYSYRTVTVTVAGTIEWTVPNGYKYIFEMDKGLDKINGFSIDPDTGAKSWAFLHRRIVK